MGAVSKKLKPGLNLKTAVTVGTTVFTLLQNEDFRKTLQGANTGVRDWAKRTKARLARTESSSGGARGLTSHFGNAALLGRVDALVAVIPEFEAINPELATELRKNEVELRRAVFVAGQMPLSKRRPAQRAIAKRLDTLERAMIDAVL